MRWDTQKSWRTLSDQSLAWFLADNGSYIYKNVADGQWWIDEPSGGGVYVARSNEPLPPVTGWTILGSGAPPLPTIEVHIQKEK
jgi:hypothetical protein